MGVVGLLLLMTTKFFAIIRCRLLPTSTALAKARHSYFWPVHEAPELTMIFKQFFVN